MTDHLLFGLFGLTLLGIATMHRRALAIAVSGMFLIALVRTAATDFDLLAHLRHEAGTVANLGGLLLGFAILANHFEHSLLPRRLTQLLPAGRAGAFLLIVIIALLSAVLDNIAAALIGGAAAMVLFRGNVHIGYLAAIVAASNAGGAGSVVGDTTTTMMWLDGASPWWVAEAAVGAVVAVLCVGWFGSGQQHALQPLARAEEDAARVDWLHLAIVLAILAGAVAANLWMGVPAAGVWTAIAVGSLVRQPEWSVLGGASKSSVFLLSLVLAASMMPVEALPDASAATAFGLGAVSAFFDNIPLTKLAIAQDGYDWGFLAFCVGYGGSMLWFGSSAGVAISSGFPQARSAVQWLRHGWHVALGYVLGFLAMLLVFGWHAQPLQKEPEAPAVPPVLTR